MSARATDVLQPVKDFASWKAVEKRMDSADCKAEWSLSDEFDAGSKCFTLFHELCSVDDVAWALS
eukprot:3495274-Rhodomonas_salina.1